MDMVLTLLMIAVVWRVFTLHYQRAHITLLAGNLANLQLERQIASLMEGYDRALKEDSENRQVQILENFAQTERTIAIHAQSLANAMQKEGELETRLGILALCIPYIERFLPGLTRDFRQLLAIHAAGLRHVVDNEENWSAKDRAFHLSAEVFLFQHSCHWFCKSRSVADARLMMLHKINHQKVLESVSERTRSAYRSWLQGGGA